MALTGQHFNFHRLLLGQHIGSSKPPVLPRGVNSRLALGGHFYSGGDIYEAGHDRFQCPAGKWLTLKQHNKGDRIYQAEVDDCANCALKTQCTRAQRRYVSRHAHEEAFERMEQRMQAHPEMMANRRSIVEHPFGNLKQWLFGNGRFATTGGDKS